MNRITFYLGLVIPFFALGFAMRSTISFELGIKIFQYLIIFYLPTLTFIRMKYLGLTFKEMLLALVPFYGIKYRYKVFTEK